MSECAQFWFTGTEEVHAEEEMMPVGQNILKQLKMVLLHTTISEVRGLCIGAGAPVLR